jgi:Patatin-like phospholipase
MAFCKYAPLRSAACLLLTVLLSACSAVNREAAVPPEDRRAATVLGIANARFFGDELDLIEREQKQALAREARHLGVKRGGTLPVSHVLTLSGGGDNGAFGAGLLVGWTAHGDRPEFKLVTGVSTGALISVYAFLGPEYDPLLTEISTRRKFTRRGSRPSPPSPRTRFPTRARFFAPSPTISTKSS